MSARARSAIRDMVAEKDVAAAWGSVVYSGVSQTNLRQTVRLRVQIIDIPENCDVLAAELVIQVGTLAVILADRVFWYIVEVFSVAYLTGLQHISAKSGVLSLLSAS